MTRRGYLVATLFAAAVFVLVVTLRLGLRTERPSSAPTAASPVTAQQQAAIPPTPALAPPDAPATAVMPAAPQVPPDPSPPAAPQTSSAASPPALPPSSSAPPPAPPLPAPSPAPTIPVPTIPIPATTGPAPVGPAARPPRAAAAIPPSVAPRAAPTPEVATIPPAETETWMRREFDVFLDQFSPELGAAPTNDRDTLFAEFLAWRRARDAAEHAKTP